MPLPLVEPWKPYPLTLTCDVSTRGPWNTWAIVHSLEVETNPRYTPRNKSTFCNIFLWDFTRAMGAEIPHWVDALGNPCAQGKGTELNANATLEWLLLHGPKFDWAECTEAEARRDARFGQPCVAVWRNPKGIGHVAAIMPAREPVTYIAQAGAKNFSFGPLAQGFGKQKPLFFTHP